MSANPFSLWVYLSQSPLLWLTVTLLVYAITDALSLMTHRHPLANPVLHSIWIIGAFLMLTGTSYTTYFGGAQFVHFLLGPATVALAVPLYENRKVVAACRCSRRLWDGRWSGDHSRSPGEGSCSPPRSPPRAPARRGGVRRPGAAASSDA